MSINTNNFQWLNESELSIKDNEICIFAPKKSDYFCGFETSATNGILPENLNNAPFYYTNLTGDFVMRAKVKHDFTYVYDSCTLMVMENLQVWGKLCFEYTDFNTRAVVSVVTNGVSDDANGCDVTVDELWLQVARKGNGFSFHYSLDGEKYKMVRFFSLPVGKTIKVGLVAQSPTGEGGHRFFEDFSIQNTILNNLREGK